MLLLIIISILALLYLLCQKRHQYWKERNIPSPKPTFLFGHSLRFLLKKENYHLCLKRIYDSAPGERYVGMFEGLNPVILVCDPSAVIDVTVKDHLYFNGRYVPWFFRMYDTENTNPLSDNMFTNEGDRWKVVRQRVTHAFSSSKSRKILIEHSRACAKNFEMLLKESKSLDFQDICLKYTIDIVGLWIFGIEFNTLLGKDSPVVDAAITAFGNNDSLRFFLYGIHPKLLDLLKFRDFPEKNCQFFVNLIRDIVEYRKNNNIRKDDFLDSLIDLVDETTNEINPKEKYTEIALCGNVFLAIVASYESTAITLFYTLYEIAVNTEIQDKVRNEISTVSAQHDGKLDFDMLLDLKYLDMVLAETSRKYPVDGAIFRQCTKDYVIPQTSSCIEAGTIVLIPTYGFHHDPKLYPNPQTFDPERFSPENKTTIPKGAYLGFGEGYRNCIGMKSAVIMMKVACIEILSKYKLSPSEGTPANISTYASDSFTIRPEEIILIDVSKL